VSDSAGPVGARLLPLVPEYRERVWGGRRLRAADPPIGEAWIAYGGSRVADGPFAGRTVADLVSEAPSAVLGTDVAERFGPRMPLLIKLLDPADWLSVQVHPTDADAVRLLGPGAVGKTEAWHVVEAGQGAGGRVGVRFGTTRDDVVRGIRDGTVLDLLAPLAFEPGQTILVPAGTLHTIGPDVLLYEVQQASDLTFRAWDWGRPASPDRPLHLEEAIEVADPAAAPVVCARPDLAGTATASVAVCRSFRLEMVRIGDVPLVADTAGRSFHVLTALDGSVRIDAGGQTVDVDVRDTVLVAGGTGRYRVGPADAGPVRLLRASVPG
jgi:mannose-6-phosphate isomerase